ncbi:uncharacterized protein LOC128306497 [Anopheles moucheti]|uniref:uncharacterized protein LOC128306497 n=1 Tax=Anopheles moucheti TaxID=186751 RepID=UPI0022F0B861|nr:uncharacterized protein LOC128306497 [Anopheles moucheti]
MTPTVGDSWQQLVVVLLVVAGCCVGAPADGLSVLADNSLCPEPRCVTFEEINTLWTIPDPNFFQQCRPDVTGGWSLQLMPCAPATLFSFRRQVCVHIEHWEGCGESTLPTTPGETEPTPGETEPTPGETEPTPGETDPTPGETDPPTTDSSDVPPDGADPCGEPLCDTYEHINTLWTHPSSNYFYQCRPINGAWAPIEMPCAPATLFSFRQQVCVLPEYWNPPNCAV